MDIIALVFLIVGKVANIKGLLTTAIVIGSVYIVMDLICSITVKDDEEMYKAKLDVIIYAIILTISIIFRVGM